MKQVLQDAEGIQALYKSNPHQLIEMLQHLQQLETMAEQMQSIIQPLQAQQQTTTGTGAAPEVGGEAGGEDKDIKNQGVEGNGMISDDQQKMAVASSTTQQNQAAANILEQQMQQL